MLVAYHAEFGNCNVPQRLVCNKMKYNDLGAWVAEQRTKRDALEDNQELYLSKLGLWDVSAKKGSVEKTKTNAVAKGQPTKKTPSAKVEG